MHTGASITENFFDNCGSVVSREYKTVYAYFVITVEDFSEPLKTRARLGEIFIKDFVLRQCAFPVTMAVLLVPVPGKCRLTRRKTRERY